MDRPAHAPARYDAEQLELILRLAAELDTADGPRATQPSYTFDDLARAAAGAGISPDAVQRALATLHRPDLSLRDRFMGAPSEIRYERRVDRELSAAAVAELIETVKWELGKEGVTDLSAGRPEGGWEHATEEGPSVRVQFTPRDGGTRIRIRGRYSNTADWLVVGAGGIAALATGAIAALVDPGSAATVLGIGAASAAGSWAAMRAAWRRISSHAAGKLARLADRLEEDARGVAAGDATFAAPEGQDSGATALSTPFRDPTRDLRQDADRIQSDPSPPA